MVELTTIFGLAETLAIIVGVFIALQQLNDIKQTRDTELETRQIQFCWHALERVHNKDFMRRVIEIMYHQDFKDYEEWQKKYGPSTNPDAYVDYYQVTSTIQALGYLVQKNILELEALSKHIRPRGIILLWEKIEPIVKVPREKLNPTAYDSFEYLANEMRTLLDQRMAQASTHTV
jgi:hypothetical protein